MNRDVAQTLGATVAVAALAAVVAATGPSSRAVGRPALAPGLVADRVERLRLERGDAAIEIAFAPTGAAVVSPSPGAVDPRAVRDLISAVAAARADRVVARGISRPRAILTVDAGARYQLQLGDEVPATGQVWIGLDDRHAALAPAWVGRALDRDPDALRARAVVPVGVAALGVELHGRGVDLVLAGARLARVDGDGARTLIEPALRGELLAALAELTLVDFAPAPDDAAVVATARIVTGAAAYELDEMGPCAGRADARAVRTSSGAGCVEARLLDAVWAAAARLTGPDAAAAAPWPDGELVEIAVDGGARLVRRGGGWELLEGGRAVEADPDAAAALVATLAAPATRTAAVGAVDGAAWTVTGADGTVDRWRVRGGPSPTIARVGEAVALAIDPARASTLALGVALRRRQLLRIDPSTIAGLAARGLAPGVVARGAIVGEWQRLDGGAAAVATAALPARLATLTVDRWAAPSALGSVRRRLTITFDHEAPIELALGAADRDGCWLAIDGDGAGHVDRAACAALLAPL